MKSHNRVHLFTLAGSLALLLATCNQENQEASARRETAATGTTTDPPGAVSGQPVTHDTVPTAAKPRANITIQSVEPPDHVDRNGEFTVAVALTSHSLEGASCDGNVEFRAAINDPAGATNLYLGSLSFRSLGPQESRTETATIRAPNRPGVWTLQATVQPGNCEITANRLDVRLIVD